MNRIVKLNKIYWYFTYENCGTLLTNPRQVFSWFGQFQLTEEGSCALLLFLLLRFQCFQVINHVQIIRVLMFVLHSRLAWIVFTSQSQKICTSQKFAVITLNFKHQQGNFSVWKWPTQTCTWIVEWGLRGSSNKSIMHIF